MAIPARQGSRPRRVAAELFVPVVLTALAVQVVSVALGDPRIGLIALGVATYVELATSEDAHATRVRLRRFGLGLPVRILIRSVLLVAAVDAHAEHRGLVLAYVLGIAATVGSSRLHQWLRRKMLLEEPPTGELNLGDDLELKAFLDVVRHRRAYELGLICAAELPLGVGLVVAVGGETAAGLVIMGLALALAVGIAALLVQRFRGFRRPGRVAAYVDGLRDAIRDTGAEVLVYFSGDPDSTYQLRQWIPVLQRIRQPVLLLLRERSHLERLPDLDLPVLYCRRHQDVEIALATDPKAVLYVGNAGRNMHFLRYARPKHVFLNHGDSDKISSANPVVKVYDRLFVAGELAIERYRAAGIDLPDDRFRIVGRPQLDGVLDGRRRVGDGPATVLYAPTWEGYFEAADYSSLERMGVRLVQRILQDHPDVRLVFKPHPMSGAVRPAAAAAARRVAALVRDAGGPHVVAADHPELDLLDWFDRSDVLLSDISAVVTDWLHTDKPYLVTNPRGLDAREFVIRFPSHRAAYLIDPDASELSSCLGDALGDDPLAADRAQMKRTVLGQHPRGPLASFEREIDEVIAWAKRDAHRVTNTFSYD